MRRPLIVVIAQLPLLISQGLRRRFRMLHDQTSRLVGIRDEILTRQPLNTVTLPLLDKPLRRLIIFLNQIPLGVIYRLSLR